jgi:hypothetical protein
MRLFLRNGPLKVLLSQSQDSAISREVIIDACHIIIIIIIYQ